MNYQFEMRALSFINVSPTLNNLQTANTRTIELGEHFSELHFILSSKTGKAYSWNSLNFNWKIKEK